MDFKENIMFGIQSFGIWSVYLLCILSTIACIVYGVINWNKGDNTEEEKKKIAKLEQEEEELNSNKGLKE